MAKKKKFNWSFANIRLTEEEKQAFDDYYDQSVDDFVELVELLLRDGYKLSHRYDGERDIWMTTLTATEESSYNSETSMTSRHQSFVSSVLLALYKHTVISSGLEWRNDKANEDWG